MATNAVGLFDYEQFEWLNVDAISDIYLQPEQLRFLAAVHIGGISQVY